MGVVTLIAFLLRAFIVPRAVLAAENLAHQTRRSSGTECGGSTRRLTTD
jgi:hypothetical protein